MTKWINPDVIDSALKRIARARIMVATDDQPVNGKEALAKALVVAEMTPGDFTITNGTHSGRKLIVGKKHAITARRTGYPSHISLLTPGGKLLYVTTCPFQGVSEGLPVSIADWNIEIGAPL